MATTKKASKKAVNKGRKASRPTRTKVAKAATAKAVKATTGRTMLFHPDTKIKLLQKLPKEDDAISEMFGVRTTSKRFKTWPAAARCNSAIYAGRGSALVRPHRRARPLRTRLPRPGLGGGGWAPHGEDHHRGPDRKPGNRRRAGRQGTAPRPLPRPQ